MQPDDTHILPHDPPQSAAIDDSPTVVTPVVCLEDAPQVGRAELIAPALGHCALIDAKVRVMDEVRIQRRAVGIRKRREELTDIVAQPGRLRSRDLTACWLLPPRLPNQWPRRLAGGDNRTTGHD